MLEKDYVEFVDSCKKRKIVVSWCMCFVHFLAGFGKSSFDCAAKTCRDCPITKMTISTFNHKNFSNE